MKFHGAGIAAVVGPNGCGKSNLSDAISWVLGEQSAKSLRGAKMEDVIFAGTRERKALGMASVTLTLLDEKGEASPLVNGGQSLALKAQEITITRRLYRSGESEYLINGKTARLRDIQDLFMGTGLGPESYAIIEQGRIGQILSNKPADRRAVIEEAAGITRFKTKRRLAEGKLDGAKQNLTRVFDILEEVGRQVNSLKRQAAKAKRYEELRGEMVGHLKIALIGKYSTLEREAARLALDLNQANAAFHTLATQVGDQEAAHRELQESCFFTESELTDARKALAEQRVDAERTRGRLESQVGQVESIEQRLTQSAAESEGLEGRLEQLASESVAHGQTLLALEREAASSKEALLVKEGERNRLQGALRDQEKAIETARQAVLRLLGEASTLKNQLAQTDEFLSSMERDTGRAQREEEAAAGDLKRLDATKKEISLKLESRQMQLQNTTEQRASLDEELQVRRSALQEHRRKLDETKNELSRLKARRDSLEEVLSHRSYTTGSVKRLFTAIEKGQARQLKPSGVLADFLEVEKQHEKAVEEFLHDELEYVVVDSWDQAQAGIELLRSDLDGRATFLVRTMESEIKTPFVVPDLLTEEGVVAHLGSVLKLTGDFQGAAADLLPKATLCYLTADRVAAQRLAPAYPSLYFLAADGVCYHGLAVTGGKKSGSGPLALKRELRELGTAVAASQKQQDSMLSMLRHMEEQITGLQEELEQLRAMQQNQEKEALSLNVEMRKLGEELSRVNSRLSISRLELDRLRQQREKSQGQREQFAAQVEEKESGRVAHEAALQAARQQLDSHQSEVMRVSEEHAMLRVEVASLEERRRAAGTAQARLDQQMREIKARREQLTGDRQRLSNERGRLQEDNVELQTKAQRLGVEMEALGQAVARLAEQEQQFRSRLSATEETLKVTRTEFQAKQELRTRLEVELVKAQSELKYLQETCRKELNVPIEELAQEETVPLEAEELDEAERKYLEVRTKIEALGPVNTQALEEFEEAQQRYDFLQAQRQDLLDSIRDTERAIRDIDVESRKRFSEAFEKINDNFRETFKTLFGGGIGEMRLTDTENSTESGIDILASPPGKNLQSVLLLSGGEKALTAMALLMGIFRYQPSPFCILDEVDAPLDEPNTERLTRLLREMSQHTQFVVITHAKRTMEAAQALYGVTMQEPGVSKLVSVRFQEMTPPRVVPVREQEAVMA